MAKYPAFSKDKYKLREEVKRGAKKSDKTPAAPAKGLREKVLRTMR